MLETIKMLEQVPFPESLNRVPEYATTHHETLNGQGYPRRLTAESLSIPARIMAIADIFEALTSSNRPYKAAYTLSKAMKILHGMKKDHHIDPDLFDLFLTSGVYRDYAEQFLSPEQIDDVDIHDYLGPVHP
jgi:HD-GYP domain-containing protein (c-di-GMP phosphodiesterase class II)